MSYYLNSNNYNAPSSVGTIRRYPAGCMAWSCGRGECSGCPDLAGLLRFKAWRKRTGAVAVAGSSRDYRATQRDSIGLSSDLCPSCSGWGLVGDGFGSACRYCGGSGRMADFSPIPIVAADDYRCDGHAEPGQYCRDCP